MNLLILGAKSTKLGYIHQQRIPYDELFKKVYYIVGEDIQHYIRINPNFYYIYNDQWSATNVLYSLYLALDLLEGKEDLIISYSDILYSSQTMETLIEADREFTILTKPLHLESVPGEYILKSEKVLVHENGTLREIGKNVDWQPPLAQFTGLMKIKASIQPQVREVLQHLFEEYQNQGFHEASSFNQAYLTDFLQWYSERYPIHVISIDSAWTEMDYQDDIDRFIFGTKAETLERLQVRLQRARILDQLRLEVGEWEQRREECLQRIQQQFPNSLVVVRSSTFAEDSAHQSFAGAFDSVLNVDVTSITELSEAIEQVIASYQQYGVEQLHKNQILIQPHLKDVAMSGVVMTRDLVTGAPYYIVNYDDQTDLTDTITSGTSNLKSLICLRNSINHVEHDSLRRLLYSVKEIEEIIDSTTLDIEFAIDTKGEVYIFQVRPITTLSHQRLVEADEVERYLNNDMKRYEKLVGRTSRSLFGKTSIFANMPDWNPAEIIGVRPKPLAYTLYKYLIMDDIWRESREEVGYHSPHPEVLMQQFLGQPYVDTRVSFNTMIPNTITANTAEQLLDFYMKKLAENPHLHDKVEFEILFTNYDFNVPQRLIELSESGFTSEQIDEIREALLNLTNNIVLGKVASVEVQNERLMILEDRRECLTRNNEPSLYTIRTLLEDCKPYGTLPFSNLARYAFVSVSILKSLVQKNIITEEQYNRYLRSIETVASNTIIDLEKVIHGQITKEQFLNVYGHLRPGTYDITSPRYDEAFEQYFSIESVENSSEENEVVERYTDIFDVVTLEAIDQLLREHGLLFESSQLFDFMEKSIIGREASKFEFSKNLSLALQQISELLNGIGLSNEDIQFLTIYDILECEHLDLDYLKSIIQFNKKKFSITELVKLPSVITKSQEFKVFIHSENRPNYITQKSINAPTLHVKYPVEDETLYEGKIIVIENADPGYDWIFSYPISGLITKYGGANSHMAIRCAEFDLPAAIGCGDVIYDKVIQANQVLLHCGEERIDVIS